MKPLPRILLVEDNLDDYEATVRSLRKSHFANPIHWCRNGQDALDYLHCREAYAAESPETSRPDLILLDLNMPGIDGRHLLEQIKNDARLGIIPVVVLSTSADNKDIDQCYALGASTYIQKPVNFEGLMQAIRTMKEYWFDVAILPGRAGSG
jgi:two-component system response regulator